MTDEQERLAYGVEDAAVKLGMGRRSIYEAMGSGELRSFKYGRRRLISADALREFIAKLEARASSSPVRPPKRDGLVRKFSRFSEDDFSRGEASAEELKAAFPLAGWLGPNALFGEPEE